MARRLLIAFAVLALGAVFSVPAANAAFGIENWEALTCKEDDTAGAEPCLGSEGAKLFTEAAKHPNFGITDFRLNSTEVAPGSFFPEGFVKDIRVELPVGLGVNPEATPEKCTEAQLEGGAPFVTECPAGSRVGTDYFTAVVAAGPPPVVATIPIPVYNIVPPPGIVSQVGFRATGPASYLKADLDPVDQHISFNTEAESPLAGGPPVIGSRLVFDGKAGDGYITMPSVCAGGQTTIIKVDSYEGEADEASYTTPVGASDCDKVPFEPTVGVTTTGGATDSPEPVTVEVGIPYKEGEPEGITQSHLRTAKITLPVGMGLNPSSANGLLACTDAQFAKGTNDPVQCPAASRIGSVDVESPSLPPNTLGGDVYVGQPLSSNPSSGNLFRIFIHVFSAERAVNVRLVGNVFPSLQTGQVTAVVEENPQAPFSSFKVHLDGGPKGTLTTPGICGPNATTTEFSPWTGNPPATPQSSFTLTTYAGGGPCPATLAERPFAPGYTAASNSAKAGKYSPFKVHIGRPDGQQEVKVVNVTLPKGLSGKLAGIPYCSEAALSAAAAASGATELAASSCSGESMIGTATTEAGSGSAPYRIAGKAFLAGPYKGAPLSMAIITPAVAGPYDLGTVVVRVALNVNPETAQVNAVSDPIPDVFGGVKLDIRAIDVDINRNRFMVNPTNCAGQATSGTINGGGANPADPATFSAYGVSAPFQATECGKLGFKPRFFTKLTGPTKRAKNPQLRAVVEARSGDANISRTALTLPHSLFLDQSHIGTVCTRPQLASQACPKASIYGKAEATTPLLSGKLKGNVYLVSSNHKLPDLLADLRGQVNVQLRGVISSKRGGLKTVFNGLPDVPVKKFVLNMSGGRKSLLVNSTNTCKAPQLAVLNIKGQNGKQVKKNKLKLNIASCGKKKKGKK